MIKNIKKLMIISLSLGSASAMACPPPAITFSVSLAGTPGGVYSELKNHGSQQEAETSTYWAQCWQSVEISTFGGSAMQDFNDLKINYQQKYHTALLASLTEASEQKMAIMKSGYATLLKTMNENYMALSKAKLEIKTEMLAQELDYKKELQNSVINEKNHGAFNDGNGEGGIVRTDTQSYKYFKEVCKRNKMFAKTSGAVYNQKRNNDVNKKVTAKSKQMSEVTSSTNEIAIAAIKDHASEYCSAFDIKYNQCVNPDLKLCVEDDVDSGVCSVTENEVFENTNLDTDSVNFLRPSGNDGRYSYEGVELEPAKNRIEDELFDVNYTYTEEQKKGAESFASVLVFQPAVQAPTISEKGDPRNADYVSEYSRYLANLNLSNYSFVNAVQARTDLDLKGEIPMSERDVMRYLIHSLSNPDALVAAKSGKSLSSDTMIYQLMTIKNKLELEEFIQKERIETLLAALLAAQANNPDLLNKLNSLK